MTQIRCALLAEGNSDRALLPLLKWLLGEHGITIAGEPDFLTKSVLPSAPSEHKLRPLKWFIRQSLELYKPSLLFVHRDADTNQWRHRVQEIEQAYKEVIAEANTPVVCVVPVQEMEAWLMTDAEAIRKVCNKSNTQQKVTLPKLRALEKMAQPKEKLNQLLAEVSGINRSELNKAGIFAADIAEYMEDFAPLRKLPAFAAMEKELIAIIQAQGWRSGTP